MSSLSGNLRPKVCRKDFLIRRVVRVFPLLWIFTIVYALVRLVVTRKVDLLPSFRTMVLWPLGELRPNVAWTLRHEIIFYTIFALTALGRPRWIPLLLLWLISPLVIVFSNGFRLLPSTSNVPPETYSLLSVMCNPVNLFFGAGVLAGLLKKRGVIPAMPITNGLIVCLSWVTLWLACRIIQINGGMASQLTLCIFPLPIVTFGTTVSKMKNASDQVLSALGDASYSIYLTHNLFLLLLITVIWRWIGRGLAVPVEIVMSILAVLGGLGVYRFVERPLLEWASRKLSIGQIAPGIVQGSTT